MRSQIEARLANEFERQLFSAALHNLDDAENKLRFNNFAYAIRELLRHVLRRLAPDEEVSNCSWYKNETRQSNSISRKQRVFYAVQGGLSDTYVREHLGLNIAQIHRYLKDSIKILNKYTHIEDTTFNIEDEIIEQYAHNTFDSLNNLFDAIDVSRREITNVLWQQIDEATVGEALRETILSIDEIASHHFVDEIYMDNIKVINICSEIIQYEASGSVACELQWGSGGDLRRGDGAVLSQSFPFTCRLWSPVGHPNDIHAEEDAFGVDTRSWWEGYCDEEP